MRVFISLSVLLILQLSTRAQDFTLYTDNPVEQIKISGNLHVTLVRSDSMALQFDSDSLPENLSVEWSKDKLILKTRTELKKTPAISVKLFYASISELEINRGARVQSADTLKSGILSLRVETGGKAEFAICTDSLSARVNQGADIILQGVTRSQLVNAYTVGNFLAYGLQAKNTWVKAASGAQVKINSSVFLNANASSKAFIGYLGKPEKQELKNSVGGEIIQQNR
jgi:Putative auto-transporter adhesin, head GIN domain